MLGPPFLNPERVFLLPAPYYVCPDKKTKEVRGLKDEKLIEAVKSGDEAAIGRLMDKYSRLLWSVVSAVMKSAASEEDMEECVADVFISLWQHPEKFDAERGALRTWLCIKARSLAIDRCRAMAKSGTLPLDEALSGAESDVAEIVAAGETRSELLGAVNSLERQEREIVLRRYYYEQKPKEIAASLELPVKKVENSLYRGKRRLRELITKNQERKL